MNRRAVLFVDIVPDRRIFQMLGKSGEDSGPAHEAGKVAGRECRAKKQQLGKEPSEAFHCAVYRGK